MRLFTIALIATLTACGAVVDPLPQPEAKDASTADVAQDAGQDSAVDANTPIDAADSAVACPPAAIPCDPMTWVPCCRGPERLTCSPDHFTVPDLDAGMCH